MDVTTGYCDYCQKRVKYVRSSTSVNHVFHLLMCVLTCSLWVVVWFCAILAAWIDTEPYRCDVCGR